MLLLVVIAVFLLVVLLVFVFAYTVDQKRATSRVLHERLSAVQQATARGDSQELALLRDELLSEIPALNRLLSRSRRISRLQRYLSQADMKVRAGKFLLISACCGFGAYFVTYLGFRSIFLGLVIGIIFLLAPFGYAAYRRSRRFHQFEALFPEAIDLLGRAVRAGHAFTTGLELIADEMEEPVAGEFRKLFEEQKFGLPVRDALLNLAERIPLMDVKFFVTAVMLQRETGGNLAEILDKLSYVIRERFKILRQVRVFTAQGRLTMMILMSLPPGITIMMYLMNRDFIIILFRDPLGHLLLATGIALQFIGFLLIRRIINIRV